MTSSKGHCSHVYPHPKAYAGIPVVVVVTDLHWRNKCCVTRGAALTFSFLSNSALPRPILNTGGDRFVEMVCKGQQAGVHHAHATRQQSSQRWGRSGGTAIGRHWDATTNTAGGAKATAEAHKGRCTRHIHKVTESSHWMRKAQSRPHCTPHTTCVRHVPASQWTQWRQRGRRQALASPCHPPSPSCPALPAPARC